MYLDEEEIKINHLSILAFQVLSGNEKVYDFNKVLVGFFTYFLLHFAKFWIEFCKIKIHDSYSNCMFKQIVQTVHTLTICFNRTENFGYSTSRSLDLDIHGGHFFCRICRIMNSDFCSFSFLRLVEL